MRPLVSPMRRIILDRRVLFAAFTVLTLVGIYFYVSNSSERFSIGLDKYMLLAKEVDTAAYIPGIAQNPVRQELSSVLVSALTQGTIASKRSSDAERGLQLLKESEKQINLIGDLSESLAVEIAHIDLSANSASDLTKKGAMREIVALAKKRADVVQGIRGLSYRANFETAKIFRRILDDGGKLTVSHITELNAELPTVEEQFNKRTALYEELEVISAKIDELYTAL
jgi:hypothetical protein